MTGRTIYSIAFSTQEEADHISEAIEAYNAAGTSPLQWFEQFTIEKPHRHEVLYFSQKGDTRMAEATVNFFKSRGISCDADCRF